MHCPDQSDGKSSRTEFSMPQSADGLRGWNFPPLPPFPCRSMENPGLSFCHHRPNLSSGPDHQPWEPQQPLDLQICTFTLQTNTRIQNLAAKERAEGTQTEASLISSGQRNRAAYSPTALFSRPIFLNAKAKKIIKKKKENHSRLSSS